MLSWAGGHSIGGVTQRFLVLEDVLGDGAVSGDGHEDIKVGKEALDNVATTVHTLVRHAPHEQATDHDDVRSESNGLEDIRARADTRVEDDGHLCEGE